MATLVTRPGPLRACPTAFRSSFSDGYDRDTLIAGDAAAAGDHARPWHIRRVLYRSRAGGKSAYESWQNRSQLRALTT